MIYEDVHYMVVLLVFYVIESFRILNRKWGDIKTKVSSTDSLNTKHEKEFYLHFFKKSTDILETPKIIDAGTAVYCI
jgi:hypothetical protein